MDDLRVIYEDNHLLAVVKPPGMPVQADITGAPDLLSMAKAYIKRAYGKPGEAYLGMVHRLDRPVGGVVVFARTSKAAARLSGQVAERTWDKVYLAVVEGHPPEEGVAVDWLIRDEAANKVRIVLPDTRDARRAELSWRVLARADGLSLLRVNLITGRHHQIRVQLAARGWPIWADARYGRMRPSADIALWAASVTLEHPTARTRMVFSTFPPETKPWQEQWSAN